MLKLLTTDEYLRKQSIAKYSQDQKKLLESKQKRIESKFSDDLGRKESLFNIAEVINGSLKEDQQQLLF